MQWNLKGVQELKVYLIIVVVVVIIIAIFLSWSSKIKSLTGFCDVFALVMWPLAYNKNINKNSELYLHDYNNKALQKRRQHDDYSNYNSIKLLESDW